MEASSKIVRTRLNAPEAAIHSRFMCKIRDWPAAPRGLSAAFSCQATKHKSVMKVPQALERSRNASNIIEPERRNLMFSARAVTKTVAVAAAIAGFGAAVALAGPIEDRQALMREDGKAGQELFKMFKGEAPYDAATVKKDGELIVLNLEKIATLFPPGSDKGPPETFAKPEIWTDPEGSRRRERPPTRPPRPSRRAPMKQASRQPFRLSARPAAGVTRNTAYPKGNLPEAGTKAVARIAPPDPACSIGRSGILVAERTQSPAARHGARAYARSSQRQAHVHNWRLHRLPQAGQGPSQRRS